MKVKAAGKGNEILAALALASTLAAVLASSEVQAQSVRPEDQINTQEKKKWSLVSSIGQNQSLFITGDGNQQSVSEISIAARYRLSEKLQAGFGVAGQYNHRAPPGFESEITQAAVTATTPARSLAQDSLSWTPSLSVQLPVSRQAKAASMVTSLGLSNRFDLNTEKLNWTRLSLAYMASIAYSAFQYQTSASGAVNQPWRVSQGLEASFAVHDQIYLIAFLGQTLRKSVFGDTSESLSHSEEIYVTLTPQISLSVGHQWGAPVRSANGQDLNLRLTSESDSMAYVQMTVVF